MPWVGFVQRHCCAVLMRNFKHDGQTQARAIGLGTQYAVEGLKDAFALGHRNAWPRVFHLQHQFIFGIARNTRCHHPWVLNARRCVVQGVFNQVAHHLFEQGRVALQPCRITRIVKAQVDVFVHGSR